MTVNNEHEFAILSRHTTYPSGNKRGTAFKKYFVYYVHKYAFTSSLCNSYFRVRRPRMILFLFVSLFWFALVISFLFIFTSFSCFLFCELSFSHHAFFLQLHCSTRLFNKSRYGCFLLDVLAVMLSS